METINVQQLFLHFYPLYQNGLIDVSKNPRKQSINRAQFARYFIAATWSFRACQGASKLVLS